MIGPPKYAYGNIPMQNRNLVSLSPDCNYTEIAKSNTGFQILGPGIQMATVNHYVKTPLLVYSSGFFNNLSLIASANIPKMWMGILAEAKIIFVLFDSI